MHARAVAIALVALAAAPALAGCITGAPVSPSAAAAFPAGEHPWPRGDGTEWPVDLVGPFELGASERVKVESHDGVVLDGWLFLPDLPDGVKAPVAYVASPYFGLMDVPPDWQFRVEEDHWLPMRRLVESGFAVAAFSVRGTGNSGGCFDIYGLDEQLDHALLVEWLAAQPWSNGRVGAMGLSYPGTTPMMAAVHNPPSLKTVVVSAVDSDVYLLLSTPQGALFTMTTYLPLAFKALTSDAVPALGGAEHATVEHVPVRPERVCPDVLAAHAEWSAAPFADARPGAFFDERRILDKFPDVTTSVFLSYGFGDYQVAFQDDVHWAALERAPKRQITGNWGHATPWMIDGDHSPLIEWLDFWLKGVGPVPDGLGVVRYQDNEDAWRESAAWPPTETRARALYLAPTGLASAPGDGERAYRAAPPPSRESTTFFAEETHEGAEAVCAAREGAPHALLYESEPLDARAVLAGAAFAHLEVTTDAPGGLVDVALFALPTGFACGDVDAPPPRVLARGAADLRYRAGNFAAEDFPTGARTALRVDLTALAEVVGEGERLALVLGRSGPLHRASTPHAPEVRVDGSASHLVLPVLEGDLGAPLPDVAYAPRPFATPPARA